jgi:hypothetical protein
MAKRLIAYKQKISEQWLEKKIVIVKMKLMMKVLKVQLLKN